MQMNVEKLVYGGSGLGFVDKMPVFVPMTVPGDVVEASVTKKHKNYIEAVALKIVTASPNRVVPKCRFFGQCGGCQWQHIDYAAQILWKQLILEEQLVRIGKIKEPNVLPTIPSPRAWNYRSRVKLHKDESGRVGFHAAGTNEVVEIDECLIAEHALKDMRTCEEDYFTQVNRGQNKNLQELIVEKVTSVVAPFMGPICPINRATTHILELYGGNGNLAFPLAAAGFSVTSSDSDRTAVRYAQGVANKNKVENIKFICQPARQVISYFAKQHKVFDCLLIDPPRCGCAEIIEGILRMKPKHIIYVSCDPSTMARDVKGLLGGGYKLVSSQPIDMFPQTFHIESVSVLSL